MSRKFFTLFLALLAFSQVGKGNSCESYRAQYNQLHVGDHWTKIAQVFGSSPITMVDPANGDTVYTYEFDGCKLIFRASSDDKITKKEANPQRTPEGIPPTEPTPSKDIRANAPCFRPAGCPSPQTSSPQVSPSWPEQDSGAAKSENAKPEILTNSAVIALVKAGLSSDVIITKVNGTGCSFQLNADGLIALKQAGVADQVIRVMLAKNCEASRSSNSSLPSPAPAPSGAVPSSAATSPVDSSLYEDSAQLWQKLSLLSVAQEVHVARGTALLRWECGQKNRTN